MFKDLFGWTKSAGKFLVRNNISASLIVAYIITPAIVWLSARLLGLNEGIVLLSLLIGMMIGLGIGLWFGWKWQDRKIKAALGGISYVAIGKYDQDLEDLQQSDSIDMIGITFHAFVEFKGPVEKAFMNGANIKVLLLDTNCTSFKEHVKKPGERREAGLIEESKQVVEAIEKLRRKYKGQAGIGQISIRYFNSIPYRGCILTNTTVHYWPYLYYDQPENTPTYFIVPGSIVGQALRQEFNIIWEEARR